MPTAPAVTEITARVAAWTASGIIDAIRNHINSGDTTHLQIDAYTAGEGLTVGFLAGGEAQQVNLRKHDATHIATSIEPSGSISDPGDSSPTAPTGTSADWSGEKNQWDVTQLGTGGGSVGAGSKAWIIETADHFSILITDTTNTYFGNGLHAGRIYVSFLSSDAAANGQDGLGFLAGVSTPTNGSADDWVQASASNNPSLFHWATGEWYEPSFLDIPSGSGDVAFPGDTAYRPLPPILCSVVDVGGGTSDSWLGVFKYMRGSLTAEYPKTITPDADSNLGFLYFHETNTTSYAKIIWDKTVTP